MESTGNSPRALAFTAFAAAFVSCSILADVFKALESSFSHDDYLKYVIALNLGFVYYYIHRVARNLPADDRNV